MRFCVYGTTLRDVNPGNYALKVDYLDNLLSLWYMIIPVVSDMFGGCKIVKGFSPMPKDCKKENVDKYERYHWSGSGLGVTGSFIFLNENELNDFLIILLTHLKDKDNPSDKITIVKYPDYLRFIRCSKSEIIESTDSGYRTIYSSPL